MPHYKKPRILSSAFGALCTLKDTVKDWYGVYHSTPDNPWNEGRWKQYVVFDGKRLVFLDAGSTLSKTVFTMLLPLLPRYKDIALKNPDYISQTRWKEVISVDLFENGTCWSRVEELSDWQMQYRLSPEQMSYFCFACVCNPFERLMHYLHPQYINPLFIPVTSSPGRIESYYPDALHKTVDLVLSLPDYALPLGLRTQYDVLHDGDKPLYRQLFRVETFLRDIAPMAKRYGICPPAEIISETVEFGTLDYRSLYTPELIERVALRYRKDIDAFGYTDEIQRLYEHAESGKSGARSTPPLTIRREDTHLHTAGRRSKPTLRKVGGYCVLDMKHRAYDLLRLLRGAPHRPLETSLLVRSQHNRKLLYIANPKCASTSIQSIIKGEIIPVFPKNHSQMRLTYLLKGYPLLQSRIAREYAGDEAPFCFSFVRNPFERLVSCYNSKILRFYDSDILSYHYNGGSLFFLYNVLRYQKWPTSFKSFVRLVQTTPDYLADAHIKSQYATLYEGGELLADYIGKVENFTADMRYLCERFDISLCNERKNPSPGYDYRDVYTPESVEIVAQRYEKDIKTFGYEEVSDELQRYVRKRTPIRKCDIVHSYREQVTVPIPAYVITINRNAGRFEAMRQSWRELGIEVSVWKGVDGLQPLRLFDHEIIDYRQRDIFSGQGGKMQCQIACYLSHYRLWRHCLNTEYERVLILEDDILPIKNTPKALEKIWHLPPSYELISLFSKNSKPNIHLKTLMKSEEPYRPFRSPLRVFGAYAYVITREGMEKLVASAMPIRTEVDNFIGSFEKTGIKNYYFLPSCCEHPAYENYTSSIVSCDLRPPEAALSFRHLPKIRQLFLRIYYFPKILFSRCARFFYTLRHTPHHFYPSKISFVISLVLFIKRLLGGFVQWSLLFGKLLVAIPLACYQYMKLLLVKRAPS